MKTRMSWLLYLLMIIFSAHGFSRIVPPWKGPPFFLLTRGTPVSDVLRDLGANYGIPVLTSKAVNDLFIGTLRDKQPDEILAYLSRLFGLIWYYNGQTLYIYKTNEMKSDLLMPSWQTGIALAAQLQASGLLDDQVCRIKALEGYVQVFGVPSCIEQVSAMAKRLDDQAMNVNQNQEAVQVFPLKYATAEDSTYGYMNQSVVVPGVVTVLRDMTRDQSVSLHGTASGVAMVRSEAGSLGAPNNQLPMISGDPRQNAVIVRDRKANLPLYADLIAKLDKKPSLIQISMDIMDVDSSNLESLGIDWSASIKIGGGQLSFNNNTGLAGGNFSTVLSNTTGFMIRLNALQQSSKAKVLSRPSIVTLNNMQAILDRTVTFYTKVSGSNTASLQAISSGSLLRVTPRLLEEGDQKEIMLTLNIQDGRQGNPSKENLPQVQNSEIITQAKLQSGQSLLLGGFVDDEEGQGYTKIPLLGDIPIIGQLFRSKSQTSHSVVRLFLIRANPI